MRKALFLGAYSRTSLPLNLDVVELIKLLKVLYCCKCIAVCCSCDGVGHGGALVPDFASGLQIARGNVYTVHFVSIYNLIFSQIKCPSSQKVILFRNIPKKTCEASHIFMGIFYLGTGPCPRIVELLEKQGRRLRNKGQAPPHFPESGHLTNLIISAQNGVSSSKGSSY